MIYLDNAATSWPKPQSVIDELIHAMKHSAANPGRSGHRMSIIAGEKLYRARETLADFFGMDNPLGVIFTQNSTHAINTVVHGILKKGDHVICTSMDHNSVLRPLYSLGEDVRLTVVSADSKGYVDLDEIEKSITPDTKLIIMSHISNVCGSIQNASRAGEIAHRHGVLFALDASQSAGILDIDMKRDNIDYLCAPGHKALYGPMGTGVLCINTDTLPCPIMQGGTGSNSHELVQPDELPDRLECGTLNYPGICALSAGINFIQSLGIKNIMKHEMTLTEYLLGELRDLKKYRIIGNPECTERSAVVSVVHESLPSTALADDLSSSYNIATRAMFHCAYPSHVALGTEHGGTLRISPGIFNTLGQIKTFLYALEKIG